ncbi:MAG: alpha/beta hydrolase [Saprospiraceae bacterium]|nr:alpha/beta hydrolase [Saprospiraceae bacterium]
MLHSFFYLLLMTCILTSCSYLPEDIQPNVAVSQEETTDYIVLRPKTAPSKTTGVFFYHGGLVDYHAYIPMLEPLAEAGYPVVIFKLVGNLAILNSNKTETYMDDFTDIQNWVVAGHSLGGVKACLDVNKQPDAYIGIILMGSYPFNVQLADWSGTVLSLYGEQDGLLDINELEESKDLLPSALVIDSLSQMPTSGTSNQSIYHEIKGGNHAYFGNYGSQNGDGVATISREEQQAEIAAYILSFFQVNQW